MTEQKQLDKPMAKASKGASFTDKVSKTATGGDMKFIEQPEPTSSAISPNAPTVSTKGEK